jgi:uncharacterized LabA/DUF88 family protein
MNHPAEQDSQEVVVFVDYQNLYNDARRAFHERVDPTVCGQIDPIRLGRLLVAREPHGANPNRTLKEVRVYRGRPDSTKEPQTYGAHMRQCAAWEADGVVVCHRPLRYPREWPRVKPEEKGIDVQLAIDVVTLATAQYYDVGIVVSTDTDLKPPLEAFSLLPLPEQTRIEVAAYKSPVFKKVLRVTDQHVWCHFIEEQDYRSIRDNRDYNIKQRR